MARSSSGFQDGVFQWWALSVQVARNVGEIPSKTVINELAKILQCSTRVGNQGQRRGSTVQWGEGRWG